MRQQTQRNKIKDILPTKIRPEWKTGFMATWIIGLLAHAYRFFNFLPTWDSMYNFTGVGATLNLGRWFLGVAGAISSKYDMPWVNGALSLFYISIAVVLLIDLYEVRERLYCILLAGLIVSFPTVTSTFAYMFTADAYMLAFLLAVAGIYIAARYKRGVWGGIACIGFSMGIYQANLSVALVMILLLAAKALLIDGIPFRKAFADYWKCIAATAGGAVFYKAADMAINAYYGVTLAGYQGIDSIGILSPAEYAKAVYKMTRELAHLWCLTDTEAIKYTTANIVVMLGLAVGTIIYIYKNRLYRTIPELILALISMALMPVAAFIVYFISVDTMYHTLMEMGVCFIYLLLLAMIIKSRSRKRGATTLRAVGLIALAFICFYNTINANIAYNSMKLSYEKSYGICSNLLDRIEDLDEYPEVSRVTVAGSYHAASSGIDDLHPAIMGISQQSFLNGDYHYISMWNYCFGRGFGMVSSEEKNEIMQTEEYKSMGTYPAKDSVAVINDIIVIKMEE